MFDNASDSFKRDLPPPNHTNSFSGQAQLPFHPTTANTGGASSSQRTVALMQPSSLTSSLQRGSCRRGKPARLRARCGLARQKKTSRNMSLLLVHEIVDLLDFSPCRPKVQRDFISISIYVFIYLFFILRLGCKRAECVVIMRSCRSNSENLSN
ncbi:hypothetical protein BDN67DRAFT_1039709 [Paxillus ammoniavirescens]|nr:hypothetical protein BDN67DRAFT_1039709 [Paxillus ammoniavirescens]